MARVCEKLYPKGTYFGQKKPGYYLDDRLKQQLDILVKNIVNDWDFTLIISGGGQVRVGKSILAMQIAQYLAYEMESVHGKKIPFGLHNFVFDGIKLIKTGTELGTKHPYSPLIYDEAGADLDAKKMMSRATQQVIDFMRECGQYNLFNILVLPDFFDMPKGIAITRSICLLDVFFTADADGTFVRGFFNFYSQRQKKQLYLNGKRFLDYKAAKPNFPGRFFNCFTVNEEEYRAAKREALKKRASITRDRTILQRNAAFYLLREYGKMTNEEIGRKIEEITGLYTAKETVRDAIQGAVQRGA